jgi:glycosyltransferase involved in cell wall biosynthesis
MPAAEGGAAKLEHVRVSVVVPVFNEEENAAPLVEGIVSKLRPLALPFELILIDDGSSDGTLREARRLRESTPELVVMALRRNFGQTLALQAGFDRARGDVVVTMDGDLQNDPGDIPRLLERLEGGADVVSGWRRDRKDTFVMRKIPSWIANRLIRWVTRVPIHDQGCSLKAYRREVIRRLGLYSDMHRFVAVLTMPIGARIDEIEVQHHARVAGESKYGISRVFKVLADLLTIQMLTRFQESPTRWFGLLGTPFLLGALATGVAAVAMWSSSIVLPTVSMLLGLVFVFCLFAGVLGEAIVDTSERFARGGVMVRELGEKR